MNVPPATVQLLPVAVALRLLSWPPLITRPGLALVPKVMARVLPPLNTSVAVPLAVKMSSALGALAATYVRVSPSALNWPPATFQ